MTSVIHRTGRARPAATAVRLFRGRRGRPRQQRGRRRGCRRWGHRGGVWEAGIKGQFRLLNKAKVVLKALKKDVGLSVSASKHDLEVQIGGSVK